MSATIPHSIPEPSAYASSDRPRIGYDARFSIGEYRGMGRYLRRLIQPVAGQSIGFCASGESDPELHLHSHGFRFYPAWEQFSLPKRVAEADIDYFLSPYNTAPLRLPEKTKSILVLHDFIYLRPTAEVPLSRSPYQNFGRLYRRMVVPQAIRDAHHIVCVSQHTFAELERRFPAHAAKATVIPNTIDPWWFVGSGFPADPDYILCVSGEAPNKNLKRAIHGFAEYCRLAKDRTTSLKIAGVKTAYHVAFRKDAEFLSVGDRVEFLPYLSDRELQSVYSGARAFLFPSRDEGFGIPVLEAMAAGVPVIASNASAIPEVAGHAALYFHPDSVHQMAEQLSTVLSDRALQRTMISRGRERARRFHPDVVDAAIADFWKQVLADE